MASVEYQELQTRQIAFSGAVDPNTNSSLDTSPVGTLYRQTGADPVIFWVKNSLGSNGWNVFGNINIFGRTVHVDYFYTGENGESDGSILRPFVVPQDAVDYAESLNPDDYNPISVYFGSPGDWDYEVDIVIHKCGVNLVAGAAATLYGTLTYTNATPESLALYKAGGYSDYSLLVNQGDRGPWLNYIFGFELACTVRLLGVQGDLGPGITDFLGWGFAMYNCWGSGTIYSRNAGSIGLYNCPTSYVDVDCFNTAYVYERNSSIGDFDYEYQSLDPLGRPGADTSYLDLNTTRVNNVILRGSAVFHSCDMGSITNLTCYDTASVNMRASSIRSNATFNNNSFFTIANSQIGGNLTVAAGNTGTPHNLISTAVAKIIDPDGKIIVSGITPIHVENTDIDIATSPEVIDIFPATNCKAAQWQVRISNGNNVKTCLVSAAWSAAGTISALTESLVALVGSITLTLTVDILAGKVRLLGTAAGTNNWAVVANRMQL
jgi:hypothetical protein